LALNPQAQSCLSNKSAEVWGLIKRSFWNFDDRSDFFFWYCSICLPKRQHSSKTFQIKNYSAVSDLSYFFFLLL
jgi:hypothetical protein